MKISRSFFFATVASLGALSPAGAEVTVPAIFSDHAVLQAAEKVPVWGKADPGEVVTVALGGVRATATAGADGKWKAILDLRKVGVGPFELTLQGRNQLVFTDVMVGQVWLCSGQSNMEWPLKNSGNGAEEVARSANPQLRHFLVDRVASSTPREEARGQWVVASPETSGIFTAVGYYFGQYLQRELHTPVGLVNASWGGTPVEAWTRREAFDADADLKAGAAKALADAAAFDDFLKRYRAWQTQYGRADRPPQAAADANPFAGNAGGWTPVQLPAQPGDSGAPEAGAVWFCRKITLPQAAVGGAVEVFLGDIRDEVKAYWNGKEIARGGVDTIMHRYNVHPKLVTAEENVLALRVFNPAGAPGIAPGPSRFRAGYRGGSLPLNGEWMARAEYAFPPLPGGAEACPLKPALPRPAHHLAGSLYNGMIFPLLPYGIAGAIWYQGEQNWDRGRQYRVAFPLMISDWRAQWGLGDFPFYFCQLANFQNRPKAPGPSGWAEVRESQGAALALPHTGQAVLIDVGDGANIHPADKRSPGERLAWLALAKTYGKPHAESPLYASASIEGKAMRVTFRNAAGGLKTKPVTDPAARSTSEVQGFAICGADRAWKWADAKIDGETVVVSSPEVAVPVAVRYAWADNPLCNLFNAEGLPASPFRTDDFPGVSEQAKY